MKYDNYHSTNKVAMTKQNDIWFVYSLGENSIYKIPKKAIYILSTLLYWNFIEVQRKEN